MSDNQFKITIAVQIVIALILIYGFFADFATIVDFRINETLQIGAVENSAYQIEERKCLFIF